MDVLDDAMMPTWSTFGSTPKGGSGDTLSPIETMETGFKPMLDQCSLKLGTYDEPPNVAEPSITVVCTGGGVVNENETVHADAIGLDKGDDSPPILMTFDWMEPDKEEIRRLAGEHNLPLDEVEQDLDETGTILMIRDIIPWDRVVRVSIGDGITNAFTLVR